MSKSLFSTSQSAEISKSWALVSSCCFGILVIKVFRFFTASFFFVSWLPLCTSSRTFLSSTLVLSGSAVVVVMVVFTFTLGVVECLTLIVVASVVEVLITVSYIFIVIGSASLSWSSVTTLLVFFLLNDVVFVAHLPLIQILFDPQDDP